MTMLRYTPRLHSTTLLHLLHLTFPLPACVQPLPRRFSYPDHIVYMSPLLHLIQTRIRTIPTGYDMYDPGGSVAFALSWMETCGASSWTDGWMGFLEMPIRRKER
ncbi:hypothetical protein C8F04DRAFT_710769 [Mycena alexandri]|uniref:Secreted protein n=1 Tax=Mycena alexandri TaxID=1745969 RepID=A0AAD6SN12_9AGAR|nr:hypothetical protein C8F04DRAFT_486753 [Mycena alexandri]KAJ7030961.1 hypothetical protein C8F04DRAFT_710769 [Mycena alexandri]